MRNAFINKDYFDNGIGLCFFTKYSGCSKPEILETGMPLGVPPLCIA